jgi:adenine-specific DNA-methyltransferase
VREYVRFTNRIPLTQDFVPSAMEQELYDLVSAYLQREDLIAVPRGQRALITLVLRRLLASSTFAIADTLRALQERLERGERADASAMLGDDFEALDELSEELIDNTRDDLAAPRAPTAEVRQRELAELKRYVRLADGITRNAKGEALVAALDTAFAQVARLGGHRKAVIFTESRRTQRYLAQLLSERGWAGEVVTIDGQNTDAASRALLADWQKRHAGESVVTGSRAADTRSAIVEAFRDRAAILVATEAAAEGVNLQFCSLVVNYDLPWNPQRVEQRIGRCHRYGQAFDVVVLNLVNSANAADRRVFELLSTKFRLFEGVFGASDGILGALESGVDIERRIASVYQRCRTAQAIEAEFDALQAELDAEIADRMASTRNAVLEHFDADVLSRLQIHRDQAQAALEDHQRLLWLLARHELADLAAFSGAEPRFEYHGDDAPRGGYHLHWPEAERRGDRFFRSDDVLAQLCIQRAGTRALVPGVVEISLSKHPVRVSALEPFVGVGGWLECGEVEVHAVQEERHVVCAAITDDGFRLDVDQVVRLLSVAASVAREAAPVVASELAACREEVIRGVVAQVEQRNGLWYDEEVAKLDLWADDLRLSLERELKELDVRIAEVRREGRAAESLAAKLGVQQELKALESKRSEARRRLFDAQDEIVRRRDDLIAAVERQLSLSWRWRSRFTLRWRCV